MRPPILLRPPLARHPPFTAGGWRGLAGMVPRQPVLLRSALDALSSWSAALLIAQLYGDLFPEAWAQEDQSAAALDHVACRSLALRLMERLSWSGRLPICEAWLDDWWAETDDPSWTAHESEDPLQVVPIEMLYAYDWERYSSGERPEGADLVLATLFFGLEDTFGALLDADTAAQDDPNLLSLLGRIRRAIEEGSLSLDRLRACGDTLTGVPEPYCHLPLLARHMDATVGCPFLDCAEDDNLRFVAWSEAPALCHQWDEAQGLLTVLSDLRHASEADPAGALRATLVALSTLLD